MKEEREMIPAEEKIVRDLESGDFVTCGTIGKFGEKAAAMIRAMATERWFARLHRDQNADEVKRLSAMVRELRETALTKDGAAIVANCRTDGCPDGHQRRRVMFEQGKALDIVTVGLMLCSDHCPAMGNRGGRYIPFCRYAELSNAAATLQGTYGGTVHRSRACLLAELVMYDTITEKRGKR
jgi:hypothetical protein